MKVFVLVLRIFIQNNAELRDDTKFISVNYKNE